MGNQRNTKTCKFYDLQVFVFLVGSVHILLLMAGTMKNLRAKISSFTYKCV